MTVRHQALASHSETKLTQGLQYQRILKSPADAASQTRPGFSSHAMSDSFLGKNLNRAVTSP